MGRLLREILNLTSFSKTRYVDSTNAFYDLNTGEEVIYNIN